MLIPKKKKRLSEFGPKSKQNEPFPLEKSPMERNGHFIQNYFDKVKINQSTSCFGRSLSSSCIFLHIRHFTFLDIYIYAYILIVNWSLSQQTQGMFSLTELYDGAKV